MRRLGPNGTYHDNRTLGREYAGQVEVETALTHCRRPPRNNPPAEGVTDREWKIVWNLQFREQSRRCGLRRA